METHLTLLDSTGEEVGDGSEADLLLPLERDLSGIEVCVHTLIICIRDLYVSSAKNATSVRSGGDTIFFKLLT